MEDTLDGLPTIQGDNGNESKLLANRYKVIRKLGEGGMGMVYLAEDMELDNTKVAVKFIPPMLAGNARTVKNLKKEALTAMQLSHPNIVRLHDLHTDGHQKFLVMEYIEGKTLEEALVEKDNNKLTLDELLPIAEQVASGLDYAHSKNVLHRDLKPSNIMIGKSGTVRLLDFGIAREMKDSFTRVTGQETPGTLPYMSPQQLMGEPPSPSMDIYSFAAVIYECLCGHPPFYMGDIREQIKSKIPTELPNFNSAVNNALLSALGKDDEQRPNSSLELVTMLQDSKTMSTPKDTSDYSKTIDAKAEKAKTKKKIVRIVPAMTITLLVAVFAIFLWNRYSRQEEKTAGKEQSFKKFIDATSQNEAKTKEDSIIFEERFNDNVNNWPVANNPEYEIRTSGGKYLLSNKNETKSITSSIKVNIDEGSNFEIECDVRNVNGADHGCGICWGMKDTGNSFAFTIRSDGLYLFGKIVNEKWIYLKHLTKSSYINGSNISNRLIVRKSDNKLIFLINGEIVHTAAFESFMGNRIGITVHGQQTAEFDNLIVRYLAEDEGKAKGENIIFEERFNNNVHNWSDANTPEYETRFSEGKYVISNQNKATGRTSAITVKIDEGSNFEIECDLKHVNGIDNNGYGIAWGIKDYENYFAFIIRSDGLYLFGKIVNNEWTYLKHWTNSSHVNGSNILNRLIVRKSGSQLKFLINGEIVHTAAFESFMGNRIGFAAYGQQTAEFDNLIVRYLAEDEGKAKGENIIFEELFNNNSNNWDVANTPEDETRFSRGKYVLSNQSKATGRTSAITVNIDEGSNFEIEYDVRHVSGITDHGYGLLWGMKDAMNSFAFIIRSDGLYLFGKIVNNEWTYLKHWTNSSHVNGSNILNRLIVRKSGSQLKFLINGEIVHTAAFESFMGNRIGFAAYGQQTAEFDNLIVRYLAEDEGKAKRENIIFEERFNNNSNNWDVANTPEGETRFSEEKYVLSNQSKAKGRTSLITVKIDEGSNFEIECDIRHVSGVSNYGYGILWGSKDSENFFSFQISSNGQFQYFKKVNGKLTFIKQWTKSSHINVGNTSNRLIVRKRGYGLKFLINGEIVHTAAFESFMGNQIGFAVYGQQTAEFDNLVVRNIK